MKVYKLEVMVLDLDEIGEQDIRDVIENTRYPNHCIHPKVKAIESRDIGEWSDDHPMNQKALADDEYRRLFAPNTVGQARAVVSCPVPAGSPVQESLAQYAHVAWSGWMRHLFNKTTLNADGTATIPAWAVERWMRQMNTQYADLPENEKDSDRVEADSMIGIMVNAEHDTRHGT